MRSQRLSGRIFSLSMIESTEQRELIKKRIGFLFDKELLEEIYQVGKIKTIEPEEMAHLEGLKVLVVNALRKEPHHSHLNLEEALAFVDQVRPERAYFTHISHSMGFHAEVERELPDNVHLAYDNLSLTL